GAPPSPAALPPGCPFAPRCPLAAPKCTTIEPALVQVGAAHAAACLLTGEEAVFERGSPRTRRPRGDAPVVLAVDGLVKHFPLTKGAVFKRAVGMVRAVDGVSFDVRRGETLGLVGESGCGKTTTLQQIMELAPPQAGRITVLGHDTAGLDRIRRRALRAGVQIVFQDPAAALDPRMPVGDLVAEPLRAHGRPDVERRVGELLRLVG
ncbi:oligopeptide/dipeptide ABC transporter ATP-binding protein, partial [Nonomuraea lactucae]|uniref:oligopeptide/dipeptide ABC transporter ATP-binding protein n=1 Tax=Nonomuraea lactucae TaxID=2249762 RepID=UPI000DE3C150